MFKWLIESNRLYHVAIGFIAAIFGTIIGAIEVATAMEGKDCHHAIENAGLPPWKWSFRCFDWLDWTATVWGGLIGQAVQIGIAILILNLSK